jgi:hypothetical protein
MVKAKPEWLDTMLTLARKEKAPVVFATAGLITARDQKTGFLTLQNPS